MYGLVNPKKANKTSKNFLLFEIYYNLIINILFVFFWITGFGGLLK